MKALTRSQVQKLVERLGVWSGARLQDVMLSGPLLGLQFYKGATEWWLVDLSPRAPVLARIDDISALSLKVEKKPLILFLKAHFVGHKLESVEAPPELGRVVYLNFHGGRQLEVRLFPGGQNVLAHTEDKEISLFKPQELKSVDVVNEESDGLDIEELNDQWLESRLAKPKPQATDPGARVQKIKKALDKVEADIALKKSTPWAALGEWLKINQTLAVPEEFAKLIDTKKSLPWNVENAFSRAKELVQKLKGSEKRRAELLTELASAEAGHIRPPQVRPQLMAQAGAKGRTMPLENGAVVFVGKSAADNLRLLREAKAWHYWLHLRDVPGAYAIVHRQKNQTVGDRDLRSAAQFLLENSLGKKKDRLHGEKFIFIVAECRHVRPIKGDKLGRATFSHEKSLTVVFA